MINIKQFLTNIIDPTLISLNMHSEAAVKLLLITFATESSGGEYLVQIEGPALGVYQMEPATHQDLWVNYLTRIDKRELKLEIFLLCDMFEEPAPTRLVWDLQYATVMARLMYWRSPIPLPEPNDLDGLIEYYYKIWAPNPTKTSLEDIKSRVKAVLGDNFV